MSKLPNGVVRDTKGQLIPGGITRTRYSGKGVLLYDEYISTSPNTNRVLIVGGENRMSWTNKRLTAVDPVTGNISVLTQTGFAVASCAWSPDGKTIAYSAGPDDTRAAGGDEAKALPWGRRMWVMNADGSKARQLTFDPQFRDEYPMWSRDGQHVVFLRMNSQNSVSVWSVDISGNLAQLVNEVIPPGNRAWFGYYGRFLGADLIAWHSDFELTDGRAGGDSQFCLRTDSAASYRSTTDRSNVKLSRASLK